MHARKPPTLSDATPKHEQLRAYLLGELRTGRWKPGDSLPTELALAELTSISRSTVRQALAGLEKSGLIRRVRGRGTFIHEDAHARLGNDLKLLGLVIPDTRSGYYPSLQRGFHDACLAQHSQVIVSNTDNDCYRQADILLQLIDKTVAGVAIVPTTIQPTPAHQLRPLQERGIPIVFCHRRVAGIEAPLVTFPPLEVGRLAAQAMLDQGHRRVAFFSTHRSGFGPLYEQGLREGMQAGGGELPVDFVNYGVSGKSDASHEASVRERLRQILARSDRPTAIHCGFDSEAELIYVLLSGMRVKVPDELSITGFGGTWRGGAIARRLVSVALDEEELGRHAVRLLTEMRQGLRPITDTTEIMMPLILSRGETLGPPPNSVKPILWSG